MVTAKGEYETANAAMERAEGALRSNEMFMTTNSSLSFVMYDERTTDMEGNTILPAIYGLTTGSSYEFKAYNLFENSFDVVAADGATVNDTAKDGVVNTIKFMAGWTDNEEIMLLSEPFETLEPETLLRTLQDNQVNTSGSALAFSFKEASNLYLAAKDVAEKWAKYEAARLALEEYAESVGRYATVSVTVDGETTKYVLNKVDGNGNKLFTQDENSNYILNFDFSLTSNTWKDFEVEATTGSTVQFVITETVDGGAVGTTVNGTNGNSASGILTTGSAMEYTFVNIFNGNDRPSGGGDGGESGTTPETPETPDVEINDPAVPLAEPDVTEPTEPDIEIDDPDVPLSDVPGEPIEIEEPQVPLSDAPQTGDTNNAIPFVVLMMVAGFGLVITRKRFN